MTEAETIVFVLDDEAALREALQSLIRSVGLRVATFASAREFLTSHRLEAPTGAPEVLVSGLPRTGDHPMHPVAIDAQGGLYVNLGSATNACQVENRLPHAPGDRPCTELETRAGIWRYDANQTGQRFSPAERVATGIRHTGGLAVDSTGLGIYASQHGRDQLAENWPRLYQPEQGANLPAEELLRVARGADYGWPECYFDDTQPQRVLAPEYGGDGGQAVGPDGALYLADDAHGRIWRVIFRGDTAAPGVEPASAPAPGAATSAAAPVQEMGPPEGIHPEAGAEVASPLPTPPGATPAQVLLGDRVFHGHVGGATCVGGHGSDAKGTPLGPDLTGGPWLWGDGSLPALTQTITHGVLDPKAYRGVMPPRGGPQLSPAAVSAVAAYVWALGHQRGRARASAERHAASR